MDVTAHLVLLKVALSTEALVECVTTVGAEVALLLGLVALRSSALHITKCVVANNLG